MTDIDHDSLYLHPDRNLGMELVRATEAAAIRAVPFIGKGDKNAAQWLPETAAGRGLIVKTQIKVKTDWQLTVTDRELFISLEVPEDYQPYSDALGDVGAAVKKHDPPKPPA